MQGLKTALLGLALLVSAGHASNALAGPLTLNLTYEPADPAGLTGTGYVTFDDSLLLTGTPGFVAPTALDAFSLTVFGASIPGGSTSFVLGDLDQWVLDVDGSGTIAGILDLNFFMSGALNGEGIGINGADPSVLGVYTADPVIGYMNLSDITRAGIPEPASALLLGGGLIALGSLRRRARTV